jgi:hypothetical protein
VVMRQHNVWCVCVRGRKRVNCHKMRVLIFSAILSETFLIIGKTERDVSVNVYRSSCKVPVILVRFE